MSICIIMDPADNVATVLQKIAPGETLSIVTREMENAGTVIVSEEIPFGHKVSISDIVKNGEVLKFGIVIGRATTDIPAGFWAHTQNMISIEGSEKIMKGRAKK